jgi:hypothetical protein
MRIAYLFYFGDYLHKSWLQYLIFVFPGGTVTLIGLVVQDYVGEDVKSEYKALIRLTVQMS